MRTRIPSHQLSSGLYVSGPPEHHKERHPTIASCAVPYTGGDISELGKMFDIPVIDPSTTGTPSSKPSRPSLSSQQNSGSVRSYSGPLGRHSGSGPMQKKSSGPMPLQPTGLITSGPLGSGPLGSSGGRRSNHLEQTGSIGKAVYGSAVTTLEEEVKYRFGLSKAAVWVFSVVVAMGLLVGVFLMVAVKKAVVLLAVAATVAPVILLTLWNCAWGKRGLMRFVNRYPDAELRGAIDGQYVKVTGVVTCGSIPLESSYQKIPRHSEKHVADFYISDFHSGLRALVKAGYGAKVALFLEPTTVVDVTKEKRELSPGFLSWLVDRNLSNNDRIMRLKEGYIKEGSTVSVMGVVRRHDNVLMIVPPQEPVSTGCQWIRCLLPFYIEGLILKCGDNQNDDVVPV